jgi:chromosome segregation ATPase
MRRCLLLLTLVLAVAVAVPPVYAETSVPQTLILKVQKYVSQQLAASLYSWTKKQQTTQLAALKKRYAADVKQLQKLAAQGNETAKKLQQALTTFERNLPNCSKCEHSYRNLQLDLPTFERCKRKYCNPVNASWEEIASFARAVKSK